MFRMEGFQAATSLDMVTTAVPPFTASFIDPTSVERRCIAPTYSSSNDASALASLTPLQVQPPPPEAVYVYSSWSVVASPSPDIGAEGGLALVNGYTSGLVGNQIVFGNPHKGHRGLTALASVHTYNDPAGVDNLKLSNTFVYYTLLPLANSSCAAFSALPQPDLIKDFAIGTTPLSPSMPLDVRTVSHGGANTLPLRWSASTTPNLTVVEVYQRVAMKQLVKQHQIYTRTNEVKLDVAWFDKDATYLIQLVRLHGANTGGDFRSINYPFAQMTRWTATFKIVP